MIRGPISSALVAVAFALSSAALLATSGCRTRPYDDNGNPDGNSTTDLGRTDTPVDILIVMSSEAGTTSLRQGLRQVASSLFSELVKSSNWHLGIVSADLGVGRFSTNGCTTDGDRAKLNPTNSRCKMTLPSFLAGSGSTPTNFIGDPAQVFGDCYVGDMNDGCEYQQPWNAAIKALSPTTNPGFLRAGSNLAILFVVDTEDCSVAPNSDLFSNQNMLPDGTARCFSEGTICTPAYHGAGSYSGCNIPQKSGLLLGSDDIYAGVTAAAPSAREILVAFLDGNTTDVTVRNNGQIDAACQEGNQNVATPTIRLDAFEQPIGRPFIFTIGSSVCGPYASVVETLIVSALP